MVRFATVLVMGWFAYGCTAPPAAETLPAPNILWITAEDIGPAWGAYGYPDAVTPHLDRLAAQSLVYTRAYATAPICAPARSALITGVHATTMGTQHLRSIVQRPEAITPLPVLMRAQGYYTSNNSKTDYNFSADGLWSANGSDAHWRNRPDSMGPFFSVFNYGTTHEGQVETTDPQRWATPEQLHDPASVTLPPFHPDTQEMRRLWARQHDLITAFDAQVGELLDDLEADGLAENTIVFVFGDHGYGLPGYKRWLTHGGLHVPFLVHVPEAYRHLVPGSPTGTTDQLVNFADVAPTVLNLVGADVPSTVEGQAFLGQEVPEPRDYVFAARSRADDVYDMGRAVSDGRYLYVRHFMPHRPYVVDAVIFGERKSSIAELRALREAGALSLEHEAYYFDPRPTEALYDLRADPHNLTNLAQAPEQAEVVSNMRQAVREWMLRTRDTGLLPEAELMIRSANTTPYNYMRSVPEATFAEWVDAAWQRDSDALSSITDDDAVVRYWATMHLMNESPTDSLKHAIAPLLSDPMPSTALVAAEWLCEPDACGPSQEVVRDHLGDERPWVKMQAARTIVELGEEGCALLPEAEAELLASAGSVWDRYGDWYYAMFTGMALDQAFLTCGRPVPELDV
ncbi:MAG: sulfatase [Rhodothermales bacterium]